MSAARVFIVDDDLDLRRSLALLLEMNKFRSACFSSANDFLAACGPNPEGCLILDVYMPGMSGLQLQDELVLRKISLPIIFITSLVDMPKIVMGMRKGAVDFMAKPINGDLLLKLVHSALNTDRLRHQSDAARSLVKARLLKLTPREREVLVLALSGMPNKTISKELAISLRTTEGHRTRIYLKLGVDSLIELAQQAESVDMSLADIVLLPQT